MNLVILSLGKYYSRLKPFSTFFEKILFMTRKMFINAFYCQLTAVVLLLFDF